MRGGSRLDLREALVDDARSEQHAARREVIPELIEEAQDDIGDDVRRDEIRLPRKALEEIGDARLHDILYAIFPHVLRCDRRRGARVVHRDDLARAELRRRDGEHTGARADIEHTHAGPHERLERAQAHRRRRVRSRAERRLRVEPEDDVLWLRSVRLPRRLDHDVLPHALRVEIRLPVVLPIRVLHMAHLWRARRRVEAVRLREARDAALERLEAHREVLVVRQVRLHRDRLLRLRRRHGLSRCCRARRTLLRRVVVDDARRARVEERLRDELHLLPRRPHADLRPVQIHPSFLLAADRENPLPSRRPSFPNILS